MPTFELICVIVYWSKIKFNISVDLTRLLYGLPIAVLNKKVSPSRQNMSQTRLAMSRGRVLV